MNPKMNSPITLILLDRLNRKVFEFTKPYNECAELTVIHRDQKTYVYQHQTEFSSDKIFFKEAKQTLDLNEVKGTVELKADFVRDPGALDYTLFLLQHNEISLDRAKSIVNYWVAGIDPLSSDLPVVTNDNPLVSDNDAPMDILREVRKDIIKRREQDAIDAALIAAVLDSMGLTIPPEWKKGLNDIVERLTRDAHGKPVPETLKAQYTIRVGNPMSPKAFSYDLEEGETEKIKLPEGFYVEGLNLSSGKPIEEFIFKADSIKNLSPQEIAAGMEKDFIPGVGPVIRMPIKGVVEPLKGGKEMKWMDVDSIRQIENYIQVVLNKSTEEILTALKGTYKTE